MQSFGDKSLKFAKKMNSYKNLRLKPGKEKSILRKHPWIFSGALTEDIKKTEEGSLVNVCDINNQYLCTGYVQHGSIAVRILNFDQSEINLDFWVQQIQKSYEMRKQLGIFNENTNCYRLMHGEGDGISGLIVDIYNKTAVIQCHTSGIHSHVQQISEALQMVFKADLETIFDKSKESLHNNKEMVNNGVLYGEEENGIVVENGNQFNVDWKTGQKTGFFLDQRDNRKLLGSYSKGKTVLNTFAYTGGFSVYALKNGASKVDSVDISKTAIELLDKNMQLNTEDCSHSKSYAEDTFTFFKNSDETYDIVVLDPPAFAKNIGSKHNASMGYKRLNIEGLKKVKKGGLLFTFSCSQVIDTDTFQKIIYSASLESGRDIKILHRLSQGADHPVSMYHPEGEYLKGLVLFVE
jgi:23S rRNA (cytosine1962-C5)-methyltransferase